MDDQGWRLHVFCECDRILRGEFLGVVPVGCHQRMVEPVARIARVHRRPVKASGVADVGFVSVAQRRGAIAAVHPRHHFAAVTAATSGQTLGVDIALLQHEIRARLNVGVFFVAEGAGIGLQKLVSPAERTMVIHTHHYIAMRGKHLIVPALVKVIAPVGVRPTVDVVQHRPFFLRVKIGRVDDPHLHRFVIPALDGKFLDLAQCEFRHQAIVETLQHGFIFSGRVTGKYFWRGRHIVAHEHHLTGFHIKIGHRTTLHHQRRSFVLHR